MTRTNKIPIALAEIRQLLGSCLIILFTSLAHGQANGPISLVRLTITPRGMYLSQSRVKPGVVRLLIENRTLLSNPELQVTDAKAAGHPRVGKVNAAAAARKNFQDLTLPPGSYSLSLTVDPKAQVAIEVQP